MLVDSLNMFRILSKKPLINVILFTTYLVLVKGIWSLCQSVQAFTESSSSMKFLGVTVLVAFISLGGVNCYSVSRNNLQVGCSVPIEDVWTDLSRGKTSIKRLMLFQFYLFKTCSPKRCTEHLELSPRSVCLKKSVNVSSSFRLFVISP